MPIVAVKDMLQHAYDHCYAIAAFDLNDLEVLQGIIEAAEHSHSPVILNLSEAHLDGVDVELLMPAVEVAAHRSSIPVAIHLHHGTGLDSVARAINLGCNSVMVDASYTAFAKNIHQTREVVRLAQSCGIPVEGELAYVPSPEEAQAYIEQTGVDFLALPLEGTEDGINDSLNQDDAQLKELNKSLRLPLVIHADMELSEDQTLQFIAHGVSKINYETAQIATRHARLHGIAQVNNQTESYTLRNVISTEVEACLHRCDSAGRATELLRHCNPWAPVEHLIIYNVNDISEHEIDAMLVEGRQSLRTIPGVREVITARAIKEDAQYRYAWLIRFCHPAVIDSYREHPIHKAFANKLFRPIATDRISIDFQWDEPIPVSPQGVTSEIV